MQFKYPNLKCCIDILCVSKKAILEMTQKLALGVQRVKKKLPNKALHLSEILIKLVLGLSTQVMICRISAQGTVGTEIP